MTVRERLSVALAGDRSLSISAIVVTLLAAFLVALPLSWVFLAVVNRRAPIDYIEAYALRRDVQAGGAVEIRFDVNRNRICDLISVSRAVVNQSGTEHVVAGYTRSSNTRPGREVYDRAIVVPETVPPGPAWYFIRLRYGCNWLNHLGWPIVVESPRVPLTVWPRKDKVPIGAVPAAFYDG